MIGHAPPEAKTPVVARTPNKLIEMLTSKGVPKETLDSNLQIIQGDARDVEAVKKVLHYKNQPVAKIMSGIGMVPTLNFKKWDGTICKATRDIHPSSLD